MSWQKAPTEADWSAVVGAARAAKSVLLVAHISPDGDALGSAMAAGLAMRQVGIDAVVSFDEEPLRVPHSLAWIPGQDLLRSVDEVSIPVDVAMSFDASSIDRLGRLGPIAASAGTFIAVDHHRSYTGFAGNSIVDVTAPATAVLALELVDRLAAELTVDIASCIYAGLTTDTGSFKFAGTTASTHKIAARLHTAGIRHDVIARSVFDDRPFAALKLMGTAVTNAELEEQALGGLGLVWASVSKADRVALDLPLDAAEAIIDAIRTVSEAEVAVLVKEGDDGVWRVSTRSKGAVDLGEVCTSLGGGGHRFAAGFSHPGGARVAVDALISAIDRNQN